MSVIFKGVNSRSEAEGDAAEHTRRELWILPPQHSSQHLLGLQSLPGHRN